MLHARIQKRKRSLEFKKRSEIGNNFNQYIFPTQLITLGVTQVTGLTCK
jgi:hypothetical protein